MGGSRPLALSTALVALGLALACRAPAPSDEAGEATPREAQAQAQAPEPAPEPAPAPRVYLGDELELALPEALLDVAKGGYELLDAGAEPRAALRFFAEADRSVAFELTMQMRMSISGAAVPETNQLLPRIHQFSRAKTLSVAEAEDGVRVEEQLVLESFVVEGGGANDQMSRTLQAAMDEIAGFEQTLSYDDRGARVEGELSLPPNTSRQLRRSLDSLTQTYEQLMVRFPEEPVGLGARWRETSEYESSGIELEQTSQFELVGRDGGAGGEGEGPGRVTLKTQLTQRPTKTRFTPESLPGAEVELLEFDSRGAGEVVYSLAELTPVHIEARVETAFTIAAAVGEQRQEMTTKVAIALTLDRVRE